MMAYEQKNGYGALFKNTKKAGMGEGAPDYTGTVKVFDQECQLAGWIKESKSGTKYINLKITAGDHDSKAPSRKEPDDIPF
jgi:uncharacterized protein (DUF736 family)